MIGVENGNGQEKARMDSSLLNEENLNSHQTHLLFSKSTGEWIIREILTDLKISTQHAVAAQLTLSSGSFNVRKFQLSLARGALEAFFMVLVLHPNSKCGKNSLRFENIKWDKDVEGKLQLYERRSLIQSAKRIKIWIVNPTANATFDAEMVRSALERGGALQGMSAAANRFKGYRDLDRVADGKFVPSLEYQDPEEQLSEYESGLESADTYVSAREEKS